MSKSYDIFLSHSGVQKDFVEQLYTELTRQYGQDKVFFDKDSIKYGEPISSIILEYARTCKLAVAVLSEEYFTKSKAPMLELAASYTASKNGNGVPCLLPVFFELKPEHAKEFERQLKWKSKWDEWRRNEVMSDRPDPRTNMVEPSVWREALVKLLDTRGPVYKPHENRYQSAVFAENVARVIVGNLDELSKTKVSHKAKESVQQYKATDSSESVDMEHLSEEIDWDEVDGIMGVYPDSRECYDQTNVHRGSPQFFDQRERATTSGETRTEFGSMGLEFTERQENVTERERNVEVRENNVTERERNVEVRENNVTVRERNVEVRENNVTVRERNVEVRENNVTVRERNVEVRENNVTVRERNVEVRENNVTVREKNVGKREGNVR